MTRHAEGGDGPASPERAPRALAEFGIDRPEAVLLMSQVFRYLLSRADRERLGNQWQTAAPDGTALRRVSVVDECDISDAAETALRAGLRPIVVAPMAGGGRDWRAFRRQLCDSLAGRDVDARVVITHWQTRPAARAVLSWPSLDLVRAWRARVLGEVPRLPYHWPENEMLCWRMENWLLQTLSIRPDLVETYGLASVHEQGAARTMESFSRTIESAKPSSVRFIRVGSLLRHMRGVFEPSGLRSKFIELGRSFDTASRTELDPVRSDRSPTRIYGLREDGDRHELCLVRGEDRIGDWLIRHQEDGSGTGEIEIVLAHDRGHREAHRIRADVAAVARSENSIPAGFHWHAAKMVDVSFEAPTPAVRAAFSGDDGRLRVHCGSDEDRCEDESQPLVVEIGPNPGSGT